MLKTFRTCLQLSTIFMIAYSVVLIFTSILAGIGVVPWIVPWIVGVITILGAMVWTILAFIYVPWVMLKRHTYWNRWESVEAEAEAETYNPRRMVAPIR